MSAIDSLELTMPGGSKMSITMPATPDYAEWLLAGRNAVFRDFIAFYDPNTRTGALYHPAAKLWNTCQPIAEQDFWKMCQAGASTGRFSPAPPTTAAPAARMH